MAQEPDQSFDVLCSGCQEELLSDELQPAQAQTMKADVILHLREQRFDLLPLPLCLLELRSCPQISGSLPSCFIHVDGKVSERSRRALRPLLARAALLARSDIAECAVALVTATIVQLLACWADIAVALRLIGEALWTVEGTPCSPNCIPGWHVRSNLPIHQPLQEFTITVACIGGNGLRFPPLPLGEARDHILRAARDSSLRRAPVACTPTTMQL